jgi:hypothetical protein
VSNARGGEIGGVSNARGGEIGGVSNARGGEIGGVSNAPPGGADGDVSYAAQEEPATTQPASKATRLIFMLKLLRVRVF